MFSRAHLIFLLTVAAFMPDALGRKSIASIWLVINTDYDAAADSVPALGLARREAAGYIDALMVDGLNIVGRRKSLLNHNS